MTEHHGALGAKGCKMAAPSNYFCKLRLATDAATVSDGAAVWEGAVLLARH